MDKEAHYGVAAHFAYKEKDNKKSRESKSKLKWMEELKNLNHIPEAPKKFIEHIKMDFFNK